jgi:hypothetical protein
VPLLAVAQGFVIRTTTIIDGKGRVLLNQDIVISGSPITAVRESRGPANYDLSGFTLPPRLDRYARSPGLALQQRESPWDAKWGTFFMSPEVFTGLVYAGV